MRRKCFSGEIPNKKFVLNINQNGDGQLSWSEFKKLGHIDCDEDKRAALEAFNQIDADGDGQVSKAEFIKIMSKSKGILRTKNL